jgi:hypothetical protein
MHMRSSGNGKHTTAADHMPSSHRRTSTGPLAAFAGMLCPHWVGNRGTLRSHPRATAHPEWGTGPRAISCRNTGRHHLGIPGREEWASILRSVAKAEPEIGSSDT